MATTAILIDGGFYRAVGRYAGLIKTSAAETAEILEKYCYKHIADEKDINARHLYRIFYYDCPPTDSPVYHPFKKENIDMKASDTYKWSQEFYKELKCKRKFALRMGTLSNFPEYSLKQEVQRNLFSGAIKFENITEKDFRFHVDQKGVDMRIGLDIASLAYKRQVDQIILIAGDSDFVPAVKHARREGIDVILDCMGRKVTDVLAEHVDGMKTHYKDWEDKKSR